MIRNYSALVCDLCEWTLEEGTGGSLAPVQNLVLG